MVTWGQENLRGLRKSSQIVQRNAEKRRAKLLAANLCTAIAEVVRKLRRIVTADYTDYTDFPYPGNPCNPWLTSVAALPRYASALKGELGSVPCHSPFLHVSRFTFHFRVPDLRTAALR